MRTKRSLDDDDDEANADLSLAILAKAQAKKSRSSKSSTDDDADTGGKVFQAVEEPTTTSRGPQEGKTKTKKKKKKKKEEAEVIDAGSDMLKDVNIVEAEKAGDPVFRVVGDDDKNNFEMLKDANIVEVEKAEGDTVFSVVGGDGGDNLEMRKLLRGPRYFDLPEEKTCFRCGNSGHLAADCCEEAPKKACYVCGSFDHEAKDCPKGSCFICKGIGHFAKSCPNKGTGRDRDSEVNKVCLRCGDIGHDMIGCYREYHPADLKIIQCYICKKYGHLCCVDVVVTSEREVSCYNCGELGHTGVGCAKSRYHIDNDKQPAKVCYRCGEEGHFARGCSLRDEDDSWPEFQTPVVRKVHHKTEFHGFRSVPAAVGKQPYWSDHRAHVGKWPEYRGTMDESDVWTNTYLDRRFQDHSEYSNTVSNRKTHTAHKSRWNDSYSDRFEFTTPSSDEVKTSRRKHYHQNFHKSNQKKKRR